MMQATQAPRTPRSSERLIHGVELLVFLFLLLPSLALSAFAGSAAATGASFPLLAVATVLRDLALVALLLFFVWRNGEPIAHLGWTAAHLGRELLLGFVLFVPTSIAIAALEIALRSLGLSAPHHLPRALTPERGPQTVLAVVLVVVVAIAEETIFRGYLLGRLRELLRSTPVAILLSAGLFTMGHAYEGAAGLIAVGLLGVLFAIVYLWRGSLVAPMVMHFCQDFLAVALLPYLAHHA